MKELDDLELKAEIDNISKKIKTILQKVENLDSSLTSETNNNPISGIEKKNVERSV